MGTPLNAAKKTMPLTFQHGCRIGPQKFTPDGPMSSHGLRVGNLWCQRWWEQAGPNKKHDFDHGKYRADAHKRTNGVPIYLDRVQNAREHLSVEPLAGDRFRDNLDGIGRICANCGRTTVKPLPKINVGMTNDGQTSCKQILTLTGPAVGRPGQSRVCCGLSTCDPNVGAFVGLGFNHGCGESGARPLEGLAGGNLKEICAHAPVIALQRVEIMFWMRCRS